MKKLLLALALVFASSIALGQSTYREHILRSLTASTTTGVGSSFDTLSNSIDYQDPGALVLVRVSAVSGTTPTLTVNLQCEDSAFGNLTTVGSSAEITATGFYFFNVTRVCSRLRAAWTIGGTTPSFTFSTVVVRR